MESISLIKKFNMQRRVPQAQYETVLNAIFYISLKKIDIFLCSKMESINALLNECHKSKMYYI